MSTSPKIRIFSIWHQKLFPELVSDLPKADRENVIFYAVNERIPKEFPAADDEAFEGYRYMEEYKLEPYEPLWQRKNYCQTSCLIHLYTNNILETEGLTDTDYVGFIQYDTYMGEGMIRGIRETVCANPGKSIVFHDLLLDYGIGLYSHPGSNFMDVINHYNEFFKTNVTIEGIKYDPRVRNSFPFLHTFVIPVAMFKKMMSWMTVYLTKLEQTNTYPTTMSQAEFAERVHALFLALELANDDTQLNVMNVEHRYPMYHDKVPYENYKAKV